MPRLPVVTECTLSELALPSRPREWETFMRVNDILELANRESPEPAVDAPLFNIWRKPPV